MGNDDNGTPSFPDAWERAARERELELAEREVIVKEKGLVLEQREAPKRIWTHSVPIVVAILAAAVAAGGNAYVANINGKEQRDLEDRKAENARILQVLNAPTPERAEENLRFLLKAKLVTNEKVVTGIQEYLDTPRQHGGPLISSYNFVTGTTYPDGSTYSAPDVSPEQGDIHPKRETRPDAK